MNRKHYLIKFIFRIFKNKKIIFVNLAVYKNYNKFINKIINILVEIFNTITNNKD